MPRLRYAGVVGTIGSGNLTSSATTHTFTAPLVYGDALSATTLPTLTGSDYFLLSVLDASGNLSEVVKVTAYNSGTGAATIVRGQEGTTGVAHTSGDKVTMAAYPSDLITVHDRRWYPGSGETSIDEFEDSSLDASWTRVDGTGAASGNLAWTEGGDVLSGYNKGGDSTDKFHAMLRPLSGAGGSMSPGDAFITQLSLWAPIANYSFVGLVLTDGTTFGSGNQVWAEVGVNTAGTTLQSFSWTGFGTSGSSAGTITASATLILPSVYVRLVMTAANTWRADFSSDGVSWLLGASTLSKTITPTHIGFFDSSYGSATQHIVSYEFLRRVAGVS